MTYPTYYLLVPVRYYVPIGNPAAWPVGTPLYLSNQTHEQLPPDWVYVTNGEEKDVRAVPTDYLCSVTEISEPICQRAALIAAKLIRRTHLEYNNPAIAKIHDKASYLLTQLDISFSRRWETGARLHASSIDEAITEWNTQRSLLDKDSSSHRQLTYIIETTSMVYILMTRRSDEIRGITIQDNLAWSQAVTAFANTHDLKKAVDVFLTKSLPGQNEAAPTVSKADTHPVITMQPLEIATVHIPKAKIGQIPFDDIHITKNGENTTITATVKNQAPTDIIDHLTRPEEPLDLPNPLKAKDKVKFWIGDDIPLHDPDGQGFVGEPSPTPSNDEAKPNNTPDETPEVIKADIGLGTIIQEIPTPTCRDGSLLQTPIAGKVVKISDHEYGLLSQFALIHSVEGKVYRLHPMTTYLLKKLEEILSRNHHEG